MSVRQYTLPVEQTQWKIPSPTTVIFNWEYDENRDKLLNLYEKGKEKQWNSNHRLNWSQEVDLSNPLGWGDEAHPLYNTGIWPKLSEKNKADLRLHGAAWQFSQFLHGEQGALICTAKIVQAVPQMDAKFYAATQVMDEGRHVETYSRYLGEKLGLVYPINPHLQTLLGNILSDGRWDFIYLGMQILVEGLALAAFNTIRDMAQEPLAQALTAFVMQDEARHVAFGRLSLRDYYPQLTDKERDEREEFVVEACYLMRDRFLSEEVYQNLGFNLSEVIPHLEQGQGQREFRKMLFSRIVPAIKDIGLWGSRVQKAFADMGVIDFSMLNPEDLNEADETIAEQFDARRKVEVDRTIAAGAAD